MACSRVFTNLHHAIAKLRLVIARNELKANNEAILSAKVFWGNDCHSRFALNRLC